jgi:single-stranded DNA-binding protein
MTSNGAASRGAAEPATLDGIRADLRGYVDTAPRVRYHPDGEMVWEFTVRLIDSWSTSSAEVVVVRVPDRNYALLQRWAVPGRQAYLRGVLHLARWQGNDGQPRARLLLEGSELMPLDQRATGSTPAALDFQSPPMRQQDAIPPQSATRALAGASTATERAARMRRLLNQDDT